MLQELLAAGFTVTALTREGSSSTFPDGVAVVRVPGYDASEAIQAALTGQDALVSVIGTMGVGAQKAVADAAVAAGIKRFIPSEFGLNTRKLKGETIGKILTGKTGFVDYLDEKAKSNPSFSWTGLSTGLFFDFVCSSPLSPVFRHNKRVWPARLTKEEQGHRERHSHQPQGQDGQARRFRE